MAIEPMHGRGRVSTSVAYAYDPGFNLDALQNTAPDTNAKLPSSAIYGLLGGQSDATFRSVSSLYDTVIQRTDGTLPFDPGQIGSTFRCRQTAGGEWQAYELVGGCNPATWESGIRVVTWTQGCDYVGHNSPTKPCGDGQAFASAYTADGIDRRGRQWIDAGYTAYGARAGVWYVR